MVEFIINGLQRGGTMVVFKSAKPKEIFDKSNALTANIQALKNQVADLENKLSVVQKECSSLQNKLERTEFEAKLLMEINTALTSTFDLQEILPLILQVMTTLVNTQGVSIILMDNSDGQLKIAESYGLNNNDIERFCRYYSKLEGGIFEKVMKKAEPYFFGPEHNLSIPLLMSVPLISRNSVIGFLNIHSMYRGKELTPDKISLVKALSNQASIAISNAQLFNNMKQQAIMDTNTGLHNFRYFQQALAMEIEKAVKLKKELSLIILDIDFFKKVNDTYGHLYGDIVLRELAKIMKSCVRSDDHVCRYGGEEFAIIFPNCMQITAEHIAERIRSKIEKTTSNDRRQIFKDRITVSIGVAGFHPGITQKELIYRADCSLYYAKKTGRNKVCGYDESLLAEYEKLLPKDKK